MLLYQQMPLPWAGEPCANGHAAAGLWTGSRLQWHINCLELLAVRLALRRFKGLATRQACTGPYGQHCDRCVHQPPRWSTLPSPVATRPPSPPLESEASEVASRRSYPWRAQSCSRRALTSARPPGEWRLHPEVVQLIWRRFGDAQVDLFDSPDTFHCQPVLLPVRGDPRHGRTAHSWPRAYANMRFPQ